MRSKRLWKLSLHNCDKIQISRDQDGFDEPEIVGKIFKSCQQIYRLPAAFGCCEIKNTYLCIWHIDNILKFSDPVRIPDLQQIVLKLSLDTDIFISDTHNIQYGLLRVGITYKDKIVIDVG